MAIIWENRYGKTFDFYKTTILAQTWCSVTSFLMHLATQVSTTTLLCISLSSVIGVTRRYSKKETSYKKHMLLSTFSWCMWTIVLLFFLKLDDNLKDGHFACFILHTNYWYTNFTLISGLLNVFICLLISTFYAKILRISVQAKNKNVGRSKQTGYYSVVIARTAVIIITTVFLVLVPLSITSIYASVQDTDEYHFTLTILFLLPQQSISTPILYTFSTRAFRNNMKRSSLWQFLMCVRK